MKLLCAVTAYTTTCLERNTLKTSRVYWLSGQSHLTHLGRYLVISITSKERNLEHNGVLRTYAHSLEFTSSAPSAQPTGACANTRRTNTYDCCAQRMHEDEYEHILHKLSGLHYVEMCASSARYRHILEDKLMSVSPQKHVASPATPSEVSHE